jgi:hypothetical protein
VKAMRRVQFKSVHVVLEVNLQRDGALWAALCGDLAHAVHDQAQRSLHHHGWVRAPHKRSQSSAHQPGSPHRADRQCASERRIRRIVKNGQRPRSAHPNEWSRIQGDCPAHAVTCMGAGSDTRVHISKECVAGTHPHFLLAEMREFE